MNILVFSWRDPKHPMAGGAEQVMHEHMKGWVEAGHKVTLFSSKLKKLSEEENLDGIKVIRKGYQYLGVQVAGFFYYLKNKKKYDFLVDQFHGVPFFTPAFSKKPKLAVIQEPAKDVWFKNPLYFPLNLIVGLLGYIFEPVFFFFYRNTKFMTGSNSAKLDVIRYGISKNNVSVVPHGVIAPEIKHKILDVDKRKAITFFGTLSKDKGIEDALKCFSLLNSSSKYQFWVMGRVESTTYFKRLKNKAKRLGLEKKIKFWLNVDDVKKFDLLSKSKVLINPSIHEGWGLVNIEANLVGTPVVAYNSAGLVDSVKDGYSGIIVDKNTPENLMKEIKHLLSDTKKYKNLQKTSILWSKKFNWDKSKKMSLNFINKIQK